MTTGTAEATTTPRDGIAGRLAIWLLALLGVALVALVAVIPLEPSAQGLLAVLTGAVFLLVNRFAGKRASLFLVALSLTMSSRYIVWRLAETVPDDGVAPMLLGLGLALAEIYALIVLALGYLQTAWPLERAVRPLPPDPATWPSVDVFVTTYNEPMAVVRATMLAAMAIDWPPERLRVWLLDDGGRDEFRRFAEQIGCGYLARPDRHHAKAGNLNHALGQTSGVFVAVFDCDHVPTRAFLQLTMGWLVAEPKLALVQTPQHFYTPDPFQRNLAGGSGVPGEQLLFHGLGQDGADTWNAAYFSGSCAVLRRAALEEIGGFATETVTEDSHTSLRLHRRGWDSAYLRLPLAAGLATERLSAHITQRSRWACGMIQIIRVDNPLFGRGLSLAQRLCYLQATGHFLFALPRLAFLTAPLAFLLAGQSVVAASPAAIAAYALPHFFHAVATTSRLQGRWRHSFWSEIYETVLALRLIPLTLATLVVPRRGRFVVTAKGGRVGRGTFDLRAVAANLVLAVLLLAGVLRGAIGLAEADPSSLAFQGLILNLAWAVFSLVIVLAAVAVGREARRTQSHASVTAVVPAVLRLRSGEEIAVTSAVLSQDGGRFTRDAPSDPRDALASGVDVEAVFTIGGEALLVPAHVVDADHEGLRLRWEPGTLEQEALMVRIVFGRADAWSGWAVGPIDRPFLGFARVLGSIGGLFRARVPRPGPVAGLLAALMLLATTPPAFAQTATPPKTPQKQSPRPTTVRPAPQPTLKLPTIVIPSAPKAASDGLPAEPVPPPPAAAPVVAEPAPPATPEPPSGSVRHVVLNLRQLGAQGALALRGTSEMQGVEFGLRGDEVVTAASLTLSGAMSPALLPEFSNVTVTLNEQYVGTLPASRDQPSFAIELPVSPVFFQDNNRLSFRFSGRYAPECNDALSGLLWATVYDASTLTLTLQRLPPQRDLARLPLPFFDPAVRQKLALPVVLPSAPGNETLRAAAIVASWFGAQAGARAASFPVAASLPQQGDAVIVLVAGDGGPTPAFPELPAISGPTLAVLPNPADPLASILVIGGRTGEEAVAAATALSVGNRAFGGTSAVVQAPALAPRSPYDAPNWITTERPVKLGELVEASALQSTGYTGLLHVPFQTAPDFTTWRDAPFPLNIRFRAPPGPVVDVAASRLDVGVNGSYLGTFPLAGGAGDGWWRGLRAMIGGRAERNEARVGVPVHDVSSHNDLQFYFDARPLHRGDCTTIPGDLRMAIDPDSTIDLSGGIRFTELPNLAYFINSGFPFTRMADLSETAVILPDRPSAAEIGVFLDLMGRMGAATGAPVARVAITRPDGVAAMGDRDLLLIGTLPNLGAAERLLASAPIRLEGNKLAVALPTPLESVRRVFGDPGDADRRRVAAVVSAGLAPGTALLVGGESPLASGRSVVALLADEPAGLPTALQILRDPEQTRLVQGDLALLSGGRVSSYRIGARYAVGSLPVWIWPGWALRDQPFGVAALALVAAASLGAALFLVTRRRATERRR